MCATKPKPMPTNPRKTIRYLQPIFESARERFDKWKIARHQYGVCQEKSGAIKYGMDTVPHAYDLRLCEEGFQDIVD